MTRRGPGGRGFRAFRRLSMLDVLLAAVLTGLTLVTLVTHAGDRISWLEYLLAALSVAPIALRQNAPVATMAVIVTALTAYIALGYGDFPNAGVGALVGMFTVATLRSRSVAAATWLVTTAVVVYAYFNATVPLAWSEFAQAALVVLGAWVLGEGTRRWAHRAERLADQAARAVTAERVRIARELHDIVAHHMSVISLQSGLAQYVLDTDPPTAQRAITTVGNTSREALTELRRLLDVLRFDDPLGADEHDHDHSVGVYRPQPGLGQLNELVERTRGAGLPVELVVTGEVRPLPPGPDLCAYRVAQESLTNVLKHAGPATARVNIDYGRHSLTLAVTDTGRGAVAGTESAVSHGIRGMRERVALYGGGLTAGPNPGGGFEVVVQLPVGEPT